MTAEHIHKWLSAYDDGELSKTERAQVEAHLEACAQCWSELQSLRSLSSLLQESAAPEPDLSREQFLSAVLERLPEVRPAAPWRRALWAGWQAAPLVLLLGWVFQRMLAWMVSAFLFADLAGWLSLESLGPADAPGGPQVLLLYWLQLMGALLQTFTPLGLGTSWLSNEFLGLWSSAVLVLLLASWLVSWWMFQTQKWIPVRAGVAHK